MEKLLPDNPDPLPTTLNWWVSLRSCWSIRKSDILLRLWKRPRNSQRLIFERWPRIGDALKSSKTRPHCFKSRLTVCPVRIRRGTFCFDFLRWLHTTKKSVLRRISLVLRRWRQTAHLPAFLSKPRKMNHFQDCDPIRNSSQCRSGPRIIGRISREMEIQPLSAGFLPMNGVANPVQNENSMICFKVFARAEIREDLPISTGYAVILPVRRRQLSASCLRPTLCRAKSKASRGINRLSKAHKRKSDWRNSGDECAARRSECRRKLSWRRSSLTYRWAKKPILILLSA